MKIDQTKKGPKVLIYHTHSQETYADYGPDRPEANVVEVAGNKQKLTFSMYPQAPVAGQRIPALIEKYQGKLRFANGETPQFIYEEKRKRLMDTETMLATVKVLLNEIKLLLEQ